MEAKEVKLTLFGEEGAKLCANCPDPCCRWVTPPMVTHEEAQRIAEHVGADITEITTSEQLPDGRRVLHLKAKDSGCCAFYDETTKKCKVYHVRPADCRLFPLDLDHDYRRLRWIRYDVCELAAKITDDDLRHAEECVLPILGDYAFPYADEDFQLYDDERWTDLGEVQTATPGLPEDSLDV